MILLAISDYPNKKKSPDWNKPFTLVIPVRDENPDRFRQVLDAVVRSDGEKEIIIGDDGSKKEYTNQYIKILRNLKREGYNIKFYKFKTSGKRIVQVKLHKIASYDIIINLDSDVIVWQKTFVRLLSPFYDEKVGISNARIDVRFGNRAVDMYYNALYICANQNGRKGMGKIGLMPCASGELLAYRKEILDKDIDKYENAKYLWRIPVSYGEDRLLTNIILSKGYSSVYCEDSLGWTWGKESLTNLVKQQLRWRRSWIRESIRCLSFSYKRPLLFFNTLLSVILPISFSILIVSSIIRIIAVQDYTSLMLLPLIVIITTIIKDLPLIIEESQVSFVFKIMIFATTNLIFITPLWILAVITVDSQNWETR